MYSFPVFPFLIHYPPLFNPRHREHLHGFGASAPNSSENDGCELCGRSPDEIADAGCCQIAPHAPEHTAEYGEITESDGDMGLPGMWEAADFLGGPYDTP